MRKSFWIVLALVVLGSAPVAHAGPVDNFKYVFDGSTYTWQLPASPTPNATVPGEFFELENITYAVDGKTQATPGIFDFFLGGAEGGGFLLSAGGETILATYGDKLFMNGLTDPTFDLGVFTLNNGSASGPTGVLTISATPEPASIELLCAGLLTFAGIVRRKRLAP